METKKPDGTEHKIKLAYWVVTDRLVQLSVWSTIRVVLLPSRRKAGLIKSLFSVLGRDGEFVKAEFFPLLRSVYYPYPKDNRATKEELVECLK